MSSGDQTANPASAKKLKQACLPFKLVNSPGAGDADAKCRKRKLSGTENEVTRAENPKVELVNGGAKCFIKSDGEDANDAPREISDKDVNIEIGAIEPVKLKVNLSKNNTEKTDEEIIDLDPSNAQENVMDIDNAVSNSSDSNLSLNNTSVISTSESQKLGNTTPCAKKLTPSRLLKKNQESAKKEEERQRLKEEREKAKEEKLRLKQLEKEQKKNAELEAKRLRELEKEREKKQKEEERKAKELEKEQERKAKELEKEQERKQKEEEKKAKELEREKERKQKEEEKKAKELEREKEKKQKEEERKAKELEKEKFRIEKLLKEEMEKKKNEKIKAAFVGFFKPKSLSLDSSKYEEKINKVPETYFMPFQTKQDMKIAPFCRVTLNSDKKLILDKYICQHEKNENLLYLNLLKTQKHIPSKSEATWPIEIEEDADVIIIETGSTNDEGVNKIATSQNKNSCKYRWKLLQFHENKRPPYCGTWRKKSLYIKPRRPYACDKIMFDYEVDSDDEWEEEDPGESIHGTDDEVEPEDDYEVDNDVFVPHGYLSDEEGEGQNDDNVSEEVQKEKLKLLGEEFEAEIKKKTERIKPRLVGCIWIPNNVINPENVSKSVSDTLLKYRCAWDGEEPIVTEVTILDESPKGGTVSEDKKTYLPDSIIPNLITFVHGNTNGIKVAAKNFIDELVKNGQNVDDSSINLSSVRRAIKTIATKSTNLSPWSVGKDNFEKYGIDYSKMLEKEVPKPSKFSATKITSFMTSQSQKDKANSFVNNSCLEIDPNVSQSERSELIPKNLFDVNENSKPLVKDVIKDEQKINIVGGKKRITPILLSPKKNFNHITDKKHKEKSLSPKLDSEITQIPMDNTT